MKNLCFIAVLLICAGQLYAWHHWSGAGEDDLWSNPLNWIEETLPEGSPEGDDIRFDDGFAIIEDYEAKSRRTLIGRGDAGNVGEITIKEDGSLTIYGNSYNRIGADAGCTGIINIDGGTYTHQAGEVWVGHGGDGFINLYSGECNIWSLRYPYVPSAYGAINIYGGTMQVGYSSRIGHAGPADFNLYGGEFYSNAFRIHEAGRFNLAGGVLYCTDGDETSRLEGYISDGILVACDGQSGFEPIIFDSSTGMTILRAIASYTDAWGPFPEIGEECIEIPEVLTWNAPLDDPNEPSNFMPKYDKTNISYDVYFGQEGQMVFQGNQLETEFIPENGLERGQSYEWRVDLVSYENGEPIVVSTGRQWSFDVSEIKTYVVYPEDGASDVEPDVTLEWGSVFETTGYTVYLSTDQQRVEQADPSVLVTTGGIGTSISVSLRYNTTYYWRVDEVVDGQNYPGDVWSFTTVVPECSEPLIGDVTGDCEVNIYDLMVIASSWAQCNWVPADYCDY